MKGQPAIIDLLNDLLTNELTSAQQYLGHAEMCENWGFERLAQKVKSEVEDERKHADALIDRILYLDGTPNLGKLNPLHIGKTVPDQLQSDLKLEKAAIDTLNKCIQQARNAGDNGTEALLTGMLTDEEEHAHWLEEQLELIGMVGLQNYLAQQMHA